MGLPEINFKFTSLAATAIQRSQRGIVALILEDDTETFETRTYHNVSDIEKEDWSEDNVDLIEKTFLGVPSKVIVERVDESGDYGDALTRLGTKRFNYLAVPGISESDAEVVATRIKSWREDGRGVKAVLPVTGSDHEGIVDFTTEDIKAGDKTYSASEYTGRVAGALAGLSLSRSATYLVFSEVDSIKEHEDPDADIDNGQLILINDGEKIKIGRGVNSLTTIESGKSEDWKKIKIIEGHDLIMDDIKRTYDDEYVGKVVNIYDNQVLFIAAVNAYFVGLEGDVLDPSVVNYAEVNVDAQRRAWEKIGTDTSDWDDQEVKERAFQSNVFLAGRLKFTDAMEDLDYIVHV